MLICLEMPFFAVAHGYAFSYRDSVPPPHALAGRLPVLYAVRDSFDIGDIVQDTKATFRGTEYNYRASEPNQGTLHHSFALGRRSRAGLRYTDQGKGKYWVSDQDGSGTRPAPSERTPLLQRTASASGTMAEVVPREDHEQIKFDDLTEDEERLYSLARKLPFGDYKYPCITPPTMLEP